MARVSRQKYDYYNKYAGRSINPLNFKRHIRDFLHNGARPRATLIPAIVASLERLHTLVSGLPTWRFYASSLLIIYDGACSISEGAAGSEAEVVKCKIVDFCSVYKLGARVSRGHAAVYISARDGGAGRGVPPGLAHPHRHIQRDPGGLCCGRCWC